MDEVVDEVGTEPSSDADSDLFGLGWGDDPTATNNSVTERNDRTRGGKELLAFVDSGAVDNVLPSAGNNTNTTWEVADVRKPLISASRLLERGHKLVLDEKPRIQCENGDTIPLERTGSLFAVRLWIPKGFHSQG